MIEEPISAHEFKQRLAQLCLKSRSGELPRKHRDRQIILKSIVLCISKDQAYTERELNAALIHWTGDVGQSLEVDHAALRRALIDEKYLERSAGGEQYWLAAGPPATLFAAEVDLLDPAAVIQDAIAQAAERKAQFQNENRPSS